MEPLEVGMYVRTKGGTIGILGNEITPLRYEIINSNNQLYCEDNVRCDNIKKTSNNIMDLIKKRDLLVDYDDNIYIVDKVWKGYAFTTSKNEYDQKITLVDYQIKSIVTKEQFEEMKYKI